MQAPTSQAQAEKGTLLLTFSINTAINNMEIVHIVTVS